MGVGEGEGGTRDNGPHPLPTFLREIFGAHIDHQQTEPHRQGPNLYQEAIQLFLHSMDFLSIQTDIRNYHCKGPYFRAPFKYFWALWILK